MVLGKEVLVLGQVVLASGVSVLGQVVLVLEAPVSDQGWVLGRDRSGSPLLIEETCNQTSESNVFHFANSMSKRCIRVDSCTLCSTPDEYLLDQCRHPRDHHPNNSTHECWCRAQVELDLVLAGLDLGLVGLVLVGSDWGLELVLAVWVLGMYH